jgi:hypothetical protein
VTALLQDPRSGRVVELNWHPRGSMFAGPYRQGDEMDHFDFDLGIVSPKVLERAYRRLLRHGARATRFSPAATGGWAAMVRHPDGLWMRLGRSPPVGPRERYRLCHAMPRGGPTRIGATTTRSGGTGRSTGTCGPNPLPPSRGMQRTQGWPRPAFCPAGASRSRGAADDRGSGSNSRGPHPAAGGRPTADGADGRGRHGPSRLRLRGGLGPQAGEAIDPDWFESQRVDLLIVVAGRLRVDFERWREPSRVLGVGDVLVLPPRTKCRAYRWPRTSRRATVFLAVYPVGGRH